MQVRVLGPVDVLDDDGRVVSVPAAKERILLATLAAHANIVVAVDDLVDVLWGEQPPRSARKTVQTYVLHLRRVVGDQLITRAPGYLLRLDRDGLDATAFEDAVGAARLSLLRGDTEAGADALRQAIGLWRGRAFEGFDHAALTSESLRLEELRLAAVEDLFDARLDLEESSGIVGELEALAAAHPFRERVWVLLMHALYRAGRQADALRAYQRARQLLVEELGVEPGAELRGMETAVLMHDPRLDRREPPPSALYAMTPDGLRIGYWTRGEGPPDVVLCAEWVFNLELLWELPEIRPLLERLSRAARLIVVQRRGTGVSDRPDEASFAPPEDCVADVDAVLDELGCGRVALLGWGHGGQVAIAYAARRTARVSCLGIVNGYARLSATDGYDAGLPEDALEAFLTLMEGTWGTDGPAVPIFGPVVGMDIEVRTRAGRLNRLIATPREAVRIQRAVHQFDVRADLAEVRVPAMVVHLANSISGATNARWLAEHLPDAEYVELPGYYLPTAEEARAVGDTLVEFVRRPAHAR